MAYPLSVAVSVLLLVGSGCMMQPSRNPLGPDAVALLVDAQHEDVVLPDPSLMDASMRSAMDVHVGRSGTPTERVDRLRRWLHGGDSPFVHDPRLTVDARTAFRLRRGGCMTHAILFVTLARYLGVEAYYVHARAPHEFADSGEELVAFTHIAVAYDDGSETRVVDVWMPVDDWRVVRYDRVDDASALALYYSNKAVEDLTGAHLAAAALTLRFLSEHARDVPEVWSNFIAVLTRQKRFAEALDVVGQAVARFPRFKPIYTNAFLAAVGAFDDALALRFAATARTLDEEDPAFLVARGVTDYERGRFVEAARSFERARQDKGDSVVIHTWLVRAYVAAGDARSGVSAYERARKAAPNDPRLARLASEFPELQVR
jgi:tetratricopeptide (TPR) repeat protein